MTTLTTQSANNAERTEQLMTPVSIDLKIQRLHPSAVIPTKANTGDAGLDLVCVESNGNSQEAIESGIITYSTGIAVEIPEGYVGLLFPRSSIYKTDLRQCNAVGVIDSGYRGEIMVKYDLTPIHGYGNIYDIGDKIAQLVIMPIPTVNITVVDYLGESERGQGGFGSSGN